MRTTSSRGASGSTRTAASPCQAGPGLGVELDEEKVERYHQLYEQFMASPLATQPRAGPVFTKPK